MLNVQTPSGQPSLGGAGNVLHYFDYFSLGVQLQPNVNSGWPDGALERYGVQSSLPGGGQAFQAGSGGSTPNRGYAVALGCTWRRGRNTAAGTTPIDYCSNACPSPVVTKPAVQLADPFQVWEVGVQIALDAVPAVAITRDCGLVFIMSATTGYANVLRAGVAPGNDSVGFGVVFNDVTGELLWIVKKNGASGGAPLTESVSLGVKGINRIVPLKVRFFSATPASEAYLEVYVDGVLAITRTWGAGSVLPVAADAITSAQLGYYRPMIRMGQEFNANVGLLFRNFYVKAAASAALLD